MVSPFLYSSSKRLRLKSAAYNGFVNNSPKENEKDLKDIPKEIIKDLKVILVDHVDQVLVNALDIKNAKELFKVPKERTFGLKANYTGEILAH